MKFSATLKLLSVILTTLLYTGMAVADEVIIVDVANGPGTDYLDLENALFFAVDGQILLIRPGNYGAANINNKSLTLIGDGPERPVLHSISIWNIDADKKIVIRGLATQPAPGFKSHQISIEGCVGPVLVEDCVFEMLPAVQQNTSAARIVDSDKVTLTRSVLQAAAGYIVSFPTFPSVPGGTGLDMWNSNVYLYGTSVVGGNGADAVINASFPHLVNGSSQGGPAVAINQSGFLLVAGCDISGGMGGAGLELSGSCYPSSDGGTGLVMNGNLATLDSTVVGGAAGIDPAGCPQVGLPGAAFDIQGGTVQTINESYRSFEVESPVRTGGTATLTVTGVPGEFAWLLLSKKPGLVYYAEHRGVLVPDFPLVIKFLGALPVGGTLQRTVNIRPLPMGLAGVVKYEQVIVPGHPFDGVLSAPSVAVIVDSQF